MDDTILGDSLRNELKTSGLYIPPPGPTFPVVRVEPFPSLRDLACRLLANNLHRVYKSDRDYPVDVLQTLFQYCWTHRKINNANLGYFASKLSPVAGKLELTNCSLLLDKTFAPHLSFTNPSPLFMHLVEIDLSYSNLMNRKFVGALCKLNSATLRSLNLFRCKLNNVTLKSLSKAVSCLKSLNIGKCDLSKEEFRILAPHLTSLVELNMQSNTVSARDLALLTNLEVLNKSNSSPTLVSLCQAYPPGFVSKIKVLYVSDEHHVSFYETHFPHLEELSLWKALLVEDIREITFLNSLHKCTNLCHLKLRTSLTDAQCTAMAQSLTKLTALAICSDTLDDDNLRALTKFKNILYFNILSGQPQAFTAATLIECLSKWPNLETLRLGRVPMEVLAELSHLTPRLRRLIIRQPWREEIEDQEIMRKFPHGIRVTLPLLERLDYADSGLDGDFIRFNAPMLTYLDLTNLESTESQNLSAIAPNSPLLRQVYVPSSNIRYLDFQLEHTKSIEYLCITTTNPDDVPTFPSLSCLASFHLLQELDIRALPEKVTEVNLTNMLPLLRELTISGTTLTNFEIDSSSLLELNLNISSRVKRLHIITKNLTKMTLHSEVLLDQADIRIATPKLERIHLALKPEYSLIRNYFARGLNKEEQEKRVLDLEERRANYDKSFEKIWDAINKQRLTSVLIEHFDYKLRVFDLPACTSLTVNGSYNPLLPKRHHRFVLKCPNLKDLYVSNLIVTNIETEPIPALKYVTISQLREAKVIHKINQDKLVKHMPIKFPNVKSVSMTHILLSVTGLGKLLELQNLNTLSIYMPVEGLLTTIRTIQESASPNLSQIVVHAATISLEDCEQVDAAIAELTAKVGLFLRIHGMQVGLPNQPILNFRHTNGNLPSIVITK